MVLATPTTPLMAFRMSLNFLKLNALSLFSVALPGSACLEGCALSLLEEPNSSLASELNGADAAGLASAANAGAAVRAEAARAIAGAPASAA